MLGHPINELATDALLVVCPCRVYEGAPHEYFLGPTRVGSQGPLAFGGRLWVRLNGFLSRAPLLGLG